MTPDLRAGLIWILVWATLIFIAVWQREQNKLASFGIMFFILTFLPESSVYPLKDAMFEHRLYLPLIGLILILGGVVKHLNTKKKLQAMQKSVRHLKCLESVQSLDVM